MIAPAMDAALVKSLFVSSQLTPQESIRSCMVKMKVQGELPMEPNPLALHCPICPGKPLQGKCLLGEVSRLQFSLERHSSCTYSWMEVLESAHEAAVEELG